MGLSARGFYNGHIFWDSEIWMYPALLVLRPCLARQMLDYRTDGLDAARRRPTPTAIGARCSPGKGMTGGEELRRPLPSTGPLEHHITADIAIASWNYYCVTQDREWLRREGFPLMREAARFWCDRVTANADGSYSIRNVIGANEYAVGVTDNAFTNGRGPPGTGVRFGCGGALRERPSAVECGSRGPRIPHFADGTTREHAGYDGEMIKQADANLLGYPLGIVTGREAQLRDLEYYERRIDPRNGPAMSYSVFAIQYARLGMAEKACEMFRLLLLAQPAAAVRVFAETATSGNPYF